MATTASSAAAAANTGDEGRVPPDHAQAEPISAHVQSANVDMAHIALIQQVQHELRTPVHGLLGTLEELRNDLAGVDMDKETRKAVRVKLDSLGGLADRLQNVLDDFRDFALETRTAREAEESNDVVLDEEVDLGELLDEVASEAWNAQVRQVRAEGGADARLPPPPELILQTETSLRGWKTVVSKDILRKLAYKLVNNALRFTHEGWVEVSLSPAVSSPSAGLEALSLDGEHAPQASEHFLELVVQDTGEGMSREFLSHRLFEPFEKADSFKAGAGLSMTLCSSLVRQMGGAMHVSSDQGRGTVVTIKIPVRSLPEKSVAPPMASQPDQLVYLYGFEGYGLQRLAQVITAQLAVYGNLYCTSYIADADYLLLPEEVCFDVEGGIEAILAQAKDGVKIGVLQAHQDAGVEYAAFKNGSRQPQTFVTRKPFGPRCFANLLRLAEQEGDEDTRHPAEYVRDRDGHLGYAAEAVSESTTPIGQEPAPRPGPSTPTSSLQPEISVGPLDPVARAQRISPAEPSTSSASTTAAAKAQDGATRQATGKTSATAGRPKLRRNTGDSLADLVVSPSTLDEVLLAPLPAPTMEPRTPMHPASSRGGGPILDGADPAAAAAAALPERKFTVLCVEDNPLNMRLLTAFLNRTSKIQVYEAADGIEAVAQFKRHLPTVTLLDINMPRMDGFEACRHMRAYQHEHLDAAQRRSRVLKIVAVTALSDAFHRERGLECGMDDWFSEFKDASSAAEDEAV
ncbi:uncharacterized protein PSFLO_03528 [Pseudozyma flocculosa]|uniref:histidine kinase n=1 Tax=Pseudozyma flocculosa TaxID=84751 RepID=A0A5C3F467_9BASI|nr:uncharacterized protein PSFLO_03528 [Pseudozyma flocculosa]